MLQVENLRPVINQVIRPAFLIWFFTKLILSILTLSIELGTNFDGVFWFIVMLIAVLRHDLGDLVSEGIKEKRKSEIKLDDEITRHYRTIAKALGAPDNSNGRAYQSLNFIVSEAKKNV